MPDGAPEGTSEVQATPWQREETLRETVLARVEAQFTDSPEAGGDATGGNAGAGTATPPSADADAKGTTGDAAPGGDGTPAIDFETPPTDPSKFAEWVTARDAKRNADFEERLTNQRKSLVGSFQSEKDVARETALLAELDTLDDEDLAARVKTDPEAAELLGKRARETGTVGVEAARQYALERQTPLIFKAGEAIKAAGGVDLIQVFADETKAAEIAQHEAGIFGFLVEQALDAGGKHAVETFKGSAEFKQLLKDAGEQAVRDALPNIGAPPARGSNSRPPNTTTSPALSENPRIRAAQRAMEVLGDNAPTDFDPQELVGAGGSRRGRGR